MSHRLAVLLSAAVALWLMAGSAGIAAAGERQQVDLELVLAVDVSWSMDRDEQHFQRDGFVAAFRHGEVIAAIAEGAWGAIAVSYVEWAGDFAQQVVIPWTRIDGPETAHAFADLLAQKPIGFYRRTSISGAMELARALFAADPYKGLRRILDISGDGTNNQGQRVDRKRNQLVGENIVINGLPIMIKKTNPGGYLEIDNLDDYFRECVIGGSGAFLIAVTDKDQFAIAIRRKLLLEIAGVALRVQPVQLRIPTNPIDCLIGEKLWRMWRQRMNFDDM